MINRAKNLRQLEPGLNTLFGQTYNRYPKEYTEIYETLTSDRAYEEEAILSGFGAAVRKAEGAPISYDEAGEGWVARYLHETYALGFVITQEAVEDNLYERISTRYTKSLARSMAHSKEIKAISVLNNAQSANYLGGDGKPLVADDHPTQGGATYSNKSLSDISETSLEDAYIKISQFTDERGLPIAAKIKTLVIPVASTFIVERLLGSLQQSGTSDNTVNALRTTGVMSGTYVVNHYITDPDSWFVITDVPDGLKHFQRTPMSRGMHTDDKTGNMMYYARERYSFGWSDPRGVFGSIGI
jgi:hypothetical protein